MTAPRVKLDIDTTREKLAALGLGVRGDLAMQAQRRGLRAVRLKAVLMILQSMAFLIRDIARLRGEEI